MRLVDCNELKKIGRLCVCDFSIEYKTGKIRLFGNSKYDYWKFLSLCVLLLRAYLFANHAYLPLNRIINKDEKQLTRRVCNVI